MTPFMVIDVCLVILSVGKISNSEAFLGFAKDTA